MEDDGVHIAEGIGAEMRTRFAVQTHLPQGMTELLRRISAAEARDGGHGDAGFASSQAG
jgi:hypothetical protein